MPSRTTAADTNSGKRDVQRGNNDRQSKNAQKKLAKRQYLLQRKAEKKKARENMRQETKRKAQERLTLAKQRRQAEEKTGVCTSLSSSQLRRWNHGAVCIPTTAFPSHVQEELARLESSWRKDQQPVTSNNNPIRGESEEGGGAVKGSHGKKRVLVFGGFGADVLTDGRTSTDRRLNSVVISTASFDSNPNDNNDNDNDNDNDKDNSNDIYQQNACQWVPLHLTGNRPQGIEHPRLLYLPSLSQNPSSSSSPSSLPPFISSSTDPQTPQPPRVLVFGGRTNPFNPLSDLWIMDLASMSWERVESVGELPSARYRHSCSSLVDQRYLLIFGGRGVVAKPTQVTDCKNQQECEQENEQEGNTNNSKKKKKKVDPMKTNRLVPNNDLYILDTGVTPMVWTKAECKGEIPSARYSHACTVLDQYMYIHGGLGIGGEANDGVFNSPNDDQLFQLHLPTLEWSIANSDPDSDIKSVSSSSSSSSSSTSPISRCPPLYSHTLSTLPNGHLLVVGGVGQGTRNVSYTTFHAFNTNTKVWYIPELRLTNPEQQDQIDQVQNTKKDGDNTHVDGADGDACLLPDSRISSCMFVKHVTIQLSERVDECKFLICGGGALCFSFGSHFTRPVLLDCYQLQTNKIKTRITLF